LGIKLAIPTSYPHLIHGEKGDIQSAIKKDLNTYLHGLFLNKL
jgi:hypothetical protein